MKALQDRPALAREVPRASQREEGAVGGDRSSPVYLTTAGLERGQTPAMAASISAKVFAIS